MTTDYGIRISQLPDWTGGFNIKDTDFFEVARDGASYKIPATTFSTAVAKTILDKTLSEYALKKHVVGYPAQQIVNGLAKWKVTDSCLFEDLYVNRGLLKNIQIDGTLNNTRSFLYSEDFERDRSGISIWHSTGGWNLELDNIFVRKAIKAKEFIIEEISALKGTLVLSAANGQIKTVEETVYNNTEVYKVSFEGDITSYKAGDIILHQSYSGTTGTPYSKYYIAVVQANAEDRNAIYLNKSDFIEGDTVIQDIPAIGDETVQYGNITDVDRQGLIQLSAAYNIDGSGSKPYISIITGINGRYDTNADVSTLIKGNISTAGQTRSILGHLKDQPYTPAGLTGNPNNDFGILTDNGLFKGRVIATQGNILDKLIIGGNIDQHWNISGGTAGFYGGNEQSIPRNNDTSSPVRIFAGGDYDQAKTGTASVVIKADGSGSLAKGNISWDDVGNTKVIGELTIVTPTGPQDLIDYIGDISEDIQKQIDKAVESWFYPFDPADNRPPVTIWLNEYVNSGRPLAAILKQHINDTFTNVWDGSVGVDSNTGITKGGTPGASWRWTLKSGTTGNNVSDYQWTRITDTVLTEVLEQLAEAFKQIGNANDNANNKVTTYITSYPEHNKNGISADQPPLNYKAGDIWYNTTTTSILIATASNSSYNFDDWEAVVDKSLDYIKDALKQTTTIQGGLILTSLIGVGAYQTSAGVDVWSDQAGISGLAGNDPNAIRFYAGASLGSRRTVADDELGTVDIPFFIRQDGAGRVGGLVFKDGTITEITTGNSLDIGNSKFLFLGDKIVGSLATTNQPNVNKLLFEAQIGKKDSAGNHIQGSLTLYSLLDQGYTGSWLATGKANYGAEGLVIESFVNATTNFTYTYPRNAQNLGDRTIKCYSALKSNPDDINNETTLFVGQSGSTKATSLFVFANDGTGITIGTNFSAFGIVSEAPFRVLSNKYYVSSMYIGKGIARTGSTGLDYEATKIYSVTRAGQRLSQIDLSNVVLLDANAGSFDLDMPLLEASLIPNDDAGNLCSFKVLFVGRKVANDGNATRLVVYGYDNASATQNDYLYYRTIKNQGLNQADNGTHSIAGGDVVEILFCPSTKVTDGKGRNRPVAYITYIKTE